MLKTFIFIMLTTNATGEKHIDVLDYNQTTSDCLALLIDHHNKHANTSRRFACIPSDYNAPFYTVSKNETD